MRGNMATGGRKGRRSSHTHRSSLSHHVPSQTGSADDTRNRAAWSASFTVTFTFYGGDGGGGDGGKMGRIDGGRLHGTGVDPHTTTASSRRGCPRAADCMVAISCTWLQTSASREAGARSRSRGVGGLGGVLGSTARHPGWPCDMKQNNGRESVCEGKAEGWGGEGSDAKTKIKTISQRYGSADQPRSGLPARRPKTRVDEAVGLPTRRRRQRSDGIPNPGPPHPHLLKPEWENTVNFHKSGSGGLGP